MRTSGQQACEFSFVPGGGGGNTGRQSLRRQQSPSCGLGEAGQMTLGSLQTMSPTQVPSGSGFCPGLQQLGGAVAVPGQYCALGQHLLSGMHTLVASQHAHSLPAAFVHICAPLMPQHMRGLFGKNEL